MKKMFYAILAMAITAITLNSCMNNDDDDNSAKVTISYFGDLSSVNVTDANDSAFIPLIQEASAYLKMSSFNSVWQESAKSNTGSLTVATAIANAQACKTFEKKINTLTMSSLKTAIFSQHSDSLAGIGYPTAESLPLHSMELVYFLKNANSSVNLDTVKCRLNP